MESKYCSQRLLLVAIAVIAVGAMVALPATAQSDDRFEPNDHIGEAAEIEPGTYEDLRMAEDELADYYAVELDAGENLSSSIAFDHDDANLGMALIGPSWRYEDYSFSRTDGESVEVTAGRAGTYYVAVWKFDDTGADYDLTVETDGAEPEGDRFENNDDVEQAASIEPGEYENLSISADDRDVFAVQADAGEQIVAASQVSSADADLSVEVSGNGRTAEASAGTEWRPSGLVAAEDGTYYVTVTSDATEQVTYDLQVGVGPSDRFDPNERADDAEPVEPGTYADLWLAGGPDVDSYSIDVEAGHTLAVSTDDTNGTEVELRVTNEAGDVVAKSTKGAYHAGHSAQVTVNESGTYTVSAFASADRATSYDLGVAIGEPARTYGPGLVENQTIGADETRTYRVVPAEAGEQVAVATRAAADEHNLDLRILADTFIVTDAESTGPWSTAGFVADERTSYAVEVRSDASEPVAFDLYLDNGTADSFDPNEGDENAVEIEPGTHQNLSLVGPADTDYYTLDLTKGERVSIWEKETAGQPVDLTVASPDHDQIVSGESGPYGAGETASFTAESNGTYTIEVYNPNVSDHEGSTYELDVEVRDPERTYGPGVYENETVTAGEPNTYELDSVESGRQLAVGARRANGSDDLDVSLQASTYYLFSDHSGLWQTLGDVPEQETAYQLEVTTTSDEPVSYDLYVNEGAADRFDPNEDASAAAPVEEGTYENLSLVGTADTDYYSLDLEQGERVSIRSRIETGEPVGLEVQGPDDEQLYFSESHPYGAGESVDFTAESNGTYTVRAYNPDVGDHDGSTYDLEVDVAEPNAFDRQPDTGTHEEQTVTAGDPNVYEVGSVNEGELVAAVATLDDSDSDLSVMVRGPTAFYLGDDEGRLRAVEAVVDSSGTYEVEVSTDEADPVSYDFKLSTGAADDHEPNEWSDAASIDPGSYENRTLAGIADQDVYAVDLEAGERLTVDASSSEIGNMTVVAQRVNGTGYEWAGIDGDTRSLSVVANSSDTYRVIVTPTEHRSIPYDLEIDVTES